jgi:multisubunit Na+/H+ antiporter MnhE subunit
VLQVARASVLAAALYLLLVDTTSLPEIYTGAAIALLAAAGFLAAREQERPEPLFRSVWLARVWHALARIVPDIARLTLELGSQLAAPRARRGELRAVPFAHGGESPEQVGRRAASELAGSLAPNTIVIGVDPDTELLLVHQLRRSGDAASLDVLELGHPTKGHR